MAKPTSPQPPDNAPKPPAPIRPLIAPTLEDFERLGQRCLKSLPPALLEACADVTLMIENFPDDDVSEMMGIETPYDLLGLYEGVALPERSIEDIGRLPDKIHLYRRPILDYWCESGDPLDAIIRHVLIHEIGHHFGFSDDEMKALSQPLAENQASRSNR